MSCVESSGHFSISRKASVIAFCSLAQSLMRRVGFQHRLQSANLRHEARGDLVPPNLAQRQRREPVSLDDPPLCRVNRRPARTWLVLFFPHQKSGWKPRPLGRGT